VTSARLSCDFIEQINRQCGLYRPAKGSGFVHDTLSFLEAAACMFEDYFLEHDYRSCTNIGCGHSTLHGVFHWFLGYSTIGRIPFFFSHAESAESAADLLIAFLRDTISDSIPVAASSARTAFAMLSLRLCALADHPGRLKDLIAWLDCCREFCVPGEDGQGAITLATQSLHALVPQASQNLDYVADLLSNHGEAVLLKAQQQAKGFAIPSCANLEPAVGWLANLAHGELPRNRVAFVITNARFDLVESLAEHGIERIHYALAIAQTEGETWLTDYHEEPDFWQHALGLHPRLRERLMVAASMLRANGEDWTAARKPISALVSRYVGPDTGRYRFLLRHMWLVDRILTDPRHFDYAILVVYACRRWERHGYGDCQDLAEILLAELRRREDDIDWGCNDDRRLALLLCQGDPDLVLPAFEGLSTASNECSSRALHGWETLDAFPVIRGMLSEICGDRKLVLRVCQLLGQLHAAMQAAPQAARDVLARFSDARCQQDLPALISLCKLREVPLPRAVRKIINRPQALDREREALQAIDRTPAQDARLGNIRSYLADDTRLTHWIDHDLDREIPAQLQVASLETLSHLIDTVLALGWCPRPARSAERADWENARTLYYSTNHNRRLLRRLLRQRALPAPSSEHPRNVDFLAKLAATGADVDEWMRPLRTRYCQGEELELYIETDPVKIFHMGNLFGSCLSVTSFNAHATIANAAEANKQVIYAKDKRGNIVGRKLIVVDDGGVIIGFNTYGCAFSSHPRRDRPWLQIAFERFCLDIARRAHLRLATPSHSYDPQALSLFGVWYDDGSEVYMDWLRQLDSIAPEDDIATVQDYCEGRVMQEMLYALLWLGEHAVPVIESGRLQLSRQGRDFLRRHSKSEALIGALDVIAVKFNTSVSQGKDSDIVCRIDLQVSPRSR
jgi:hypothetical protein